MSSLPREASSLTSFSHSVTCAATMISLSAGASESTRLYQRM
ncbi:MAG: hypothetical protein U0269_14440 [Polyangiales bacterium]